MAELISISKIVRDQGTQPRTKLDQSIIDEYAEAMKAGATFPPVDVFKIERKYVLVDGFHRIAAAERANIKKFLCEVHEGTIQDAVLFASGVNATHGLRRTPEDKHRAVERILNGHPDWSKWSDGKIADICHVSHSFVAKVRQQVSFHDGKIASERKVKRGHKTYTMNTAKIGRKKTAKKPTTDEPSSLPESSSPNVNRAGTATVPAQSQQEPPSVELQQPEAPQQNQLPAPVLLQPAEPVNSGSTAPPVPTVFSNETCKAGKCPDGKTHYIRNPVKNRMECDLVGVEITQLPKNDCPLLIRQRKADAGGSTTATKPAEQLPDAKQEVVEQQQAPLTTAIQQQPLTHHEKEALAKRFVTECLSPERTKVLDNVIGAGNCESYLMVIEQLIDWGEEETVRDKVPVVLPDDQPKFRQEDNEHSSPESDKPWKFPTRPLSNAEREQLFAEFVQMAYSPEQQQIFRALIASHNCANEMDVLDYTIDFVGELVKAAKRFYIPKNQFPTTPISQKYYLDLQWFAPLFPVLRPKGTKYPGLIPEVFVRAVSVDVFYSLNQGGGAMN
jgi:hypothetical protein